MTSKELHPARNVLLEVNHPTIFGQVQQLVPNVKKVLLVKKMVNVIIVMVQESIVMWRELQFVKNALQVANHLIIITRVPLNVPKIDGENISNDCQNDISTICMHT